MQAVHQVRRMNVEIACQALAELMATRLLPDLSAGEEATGAIQTYVEKACVTYTLFATSDPESARDFAISGLSSLFDAISESSYNSLSARATHAAQTLIWKATGAADCESADKWCNLLRHPLFHSAGKVNKARIGRYDASQKETLIAF